MHPTCLPLNQECCRMIISMADWRGHTQCAWSARHSNTAVRVLVDAIRRFPLDVRMHTSAVRCLTKLSTMDNVETEEAETILPQIWECRRAILERGGLKAALLGPVDVDVSVCLLLQVFAEFEGFENGRWQEVAGQDCIRIVVDALRSSVVHMRMITQNNIIPASDLQHTHASTMLLAKLCQNAFNAGQVVAVGSTIVFLQVLSALRLLNTQLQVDFMDLTCPQIVICVCEALRNTVSIDGQQHHDIVLPVIRGIIRNTSNDQVRVVGCAVFGGFAQIDSTHTMFLQASGAFARAGGRDIGRARKPRCHQRGMLRPDGPDPAPGPLLQDPNAGTQFAASIASSSTSTEFGGRLRHHSRLPKLPPPDKVALCTMTPGKDSERTCPLF